MLRRPSHREFKTATQISAEPGLEPTWLQETKQLCCLSLALEALGMGHFPHLFILATLLYHHRYKIYSLLLGRGSWRPVVYFQ